MGMCACNSAGHLSNHADIAPNHAGVTFAISNTLVSKGRKTILYFSCIFQAPFKSLTLFFFFP